MIVFSTALFFPDYGSAGIPWDLYLLHFYFFAIFVPFVVIIYSARSSDRQNPDRVKDQNTRFPDLHPRAWDIKFICILLIILTLRNRFTTKTIKLKNSATYICYNRFF